MKQASQPRTVAKQARPVPAVSPKAPKPAQKDWSVRLELRLPHRIGQPLGCDTACDGSGA